VLLVAWHNCINHKRDFQFKANKGLVGMAKTVATFIRPVVVVPEDLADKVAHLDKKWMDVSSLPSILFPPSPPPFLPFL
jgi:hypothetical protein